MVSISSCLAQAEVYHNNVQMSLENLGIPEQILEEERDKNSGVTIPEKSFPVGNFGEKNFNLSPSISGFDSSKQKKSDGEKHDTISSGSTGSKRSDPISSGNTGSKQPDPILSTPRGRRSPPYTLKVSSTTDEPIIAIEGSPICISPLKLEPDDPDFVHDTKHEADGDEIIILSSDKEDNFAPIPVKQEPQSPKIKKKKKQSNLVSSVTAPSPGAQNPSTSKS